MKEILQKFCSSDATRRDQDRPFSIGEYTLATNGHILIRVPRIADIQENPMAPKIEAAEANRTGKWFLKEPAEWIPTPAVKAKQGPCIHCGGTGTACECPECGGHGDVHFSNDFNQYESVECKTCDGECQISEREFRDLARHVKYIIQKPVECYHCFQGKVWSERKQDVNGVLLNPQYLDLINSLPKAELGLFGQYDPVRFRFDGGDGLLMPMWA